MDGNRFDNLARSFAARRSRRDVVKALAGGGAGGLLALLGSGQAGADECKRNGKVCKKNVQCCSANCTPSPSGSISTAGSGSVCCAPGQVQNPTGVCCTPTTCTAQGTNCGEITDGCGGTLTCGACSGFDTCGGGGVANVCGCTPTTCAAEGATCGALADGCGRTLECGSCDASQCLTCDDTSHGCVSTCSAPRTCFGGACKLPNDTTGCVADEECGSGNCVAGTCQASDSGEGGACDADADCLDGRACVNIVDGRGVCCASAKACGTICCDSGNQICDPLGDCCTPLITSCPAQGCDLISDECGTVFDCGPCGAGEGCVDNVCRPIVCQEVLASCTPDQTDCCGDSVCGAGEVCCHPSGAACFTVLGGGNSCCDNNFCLEDELSGERRCAGCAGDFQNVPGGFACNATTLCCSGFCHTPSGNCCRRAGASCTKIGPLGGECCPYLGLTCSADGDGTCVQCRTAGQSCAGTGANSTCCLGFSCEGGVCVEDACSGLVGPCQEDSACCPGMLCDEDRGVCFIVCAAERQPCDLGCCEGLICDPNPLNPLCIVP